MRKKKPATYSPTNKMSKRKGPAANNSNQDLCDFLMELAEYEKNVTRQMHKYNAYRKAAGALSNYPTRVKSGTEAKQLQGIGDKISKKIDEYLSTGKLTKLENIRADSDTIAINDLTRVSGIGPAAARKLVTDHGIKTIKDLEQHKSLLNHHQLIGLKYVMEFESKIPRAEMNKLRDVVVREIAQVDPQFEGEACGSYRRGAQSSGDIDILLTHPRYVSTNKAKSEQKQLLKQVIDHLIKISFITDTISLGDTKFMGVCILPQTKSDDKHLHRRIDVRVYPYDQYYCGLLHFTGSDMFNKGMRTRALEEGFTINEYCIRPVGVTGVPGEALPVTSEEDIFEYISMPYRKPSERNE